MVRSRQDSKNMQSLLEEVRRLSGMHNISESRRVNMKDVIDELISDLDSEGEMDDKAYNRAVKAIKGLRRSIQSELSDIDFDEWDDEGITVAVAFDDRGSIGDFYVGNIQFWSGVSQSRYPHRAYAYV